MRPDFISHVRKDFRSDSIRTSKKGSEFTVNDMFAAACYQFVKTMGKDSLHEVPSIDEKDNIKPFQLVIKERRRRWIFFEKAYYKTTDFQLPDVMMDQDPFKTQPVKTDTVEEYNRTSKISLKGKFGAAISEEIIDLELDTTDSLSLSVEFNKVVKTEVPIPNFLTEINGRNICMDHQYIQQIRQNKKKSLCVITGVHCLQTGGTIHRDTEADIEASVKASLIKKAESSASAVYSKDRDIGLAPGTPVAYNIHELNVDIHNGAIQLVLTKGTAGGFRESVGYDETDATCNASPAFKNEQKKQLEQDLNKPHTLFGPLMSLATGKREQVNTWLLKLMEYPNDLTVISDILEDAVESGNLLTHINVSDTAKKLLSPKDTWINVFEAAGFSNEDEVLKLSKVPDATLNAYQEFFDAASMLDDDMIDLLRDFPATLAQQMLTVLREGIMENDLSTPDIIGPVLDNETSVKILLDLRYHISKDQIRAPEKLPESIDEVYWVLQALYGK